MTDRLEDRLRTTLRFVAAETVIPPVPQPVGVSARPRRSAKRRLALAAAAVGAVVAVGVPVAAAAGVLPEITAAFASWQGNAPFKADDATGHLLLTLPGPDGQPMQLYEANAVGGGQCVTMLLPDAPKAERNVISSCTSAEGGPMQTVEAGASWASPAGAYVILYGPGAGYLTLSDGITTRRFPVADGLSGAWLPPVDFGRPLTLRGFGPGGAAVGEFTFSEADPAALAGPIQRGRSDSSF